MNDDSCRTIWEFTPDEYAEHLRQRWRDTYGGPMPIMRFHAEFISWNVMREYMRPTEDEKRERQTRLT